LDSSSHPLPSPRRPRQAIAGGRASHRLSILHLVILAVALEAGPGCILLQARPPEHRWYLGGGVSILSTIDDIRNNAGIIFTEDFGDDGVPFTGDLNELTACPSNFGDLFPVQNPFCDPRPDDLLARDSMIQDGLKYDLTVGYQLTQRIGVQVDASRYTGEVGPIDVFKSRTFPPIAPNGFPARLTDVNQSTPIAAGDLTETSLSLTGIIRFRNQESLRPYLGIGGGVIFTDLDVNDDGIAQVKSSLDSLRVRGIGDEFGMDLTPPIFNGTFIREDGLVPFELPLTVEVDDTIEWHLTGGLEYFFNDRFSLVFDARYIVANQDVVIDLGGQDQLDVFFWPPELFHPDGSLKVFINAPITPNPPCGFDEFKFGCFGKEPNDRVNPEGTHFNPRDPANPLPGVKCPAFGDFDNNGQQDVCYKFGQTSPSGQSLPTGSAVVQGGSIKLTAFSVGFGLRFHL
ncbi:MAG: hypothetical protein ACE5HU_10365, partial [Acidobacteriota bacterium]